MRTNRYVMAAVVGLVALVFGASMAIGQNRERSFSAGGKAFTGRVVDLHCFMTGVYPAEDRAKCTAQCIKDGVPIGLETRDGIILLGRGMKGSAASALLAPLAYQQAEITGKLYTKGGLRYLDVTSAKKFVDEDEENEDEEDEDVDSDDEVDK